MRKRTEKQNHEILARWLIESREQRGAEAEQSAKTLTLKSPFIKEEGAYYRNDNFVLGTVILIPFKTKINDPKNHFILIYIFKLYLTLHFAS